MTDTRGIEKQFDLSWDGKNIPFNPSSKLTSEGFSDGVHAAVPIEAGSSKIPYSFVLDFKGSESISIAPVGKETTLVISSPWQSPKFIGSFLPTEREISPSGFRAEWKISSFGRPYPQSWSNSEINFKQVLEHSAGVRLHEQISSYTQVFRSVKYAVLFILITFGAFFLFEILAKIRIHPIQYFFIGSVLALFYLILLAFSEQIGFTFSYILATAMTIPLITGYSAKVLQNKRKAVSIFILLLSLYIYLYFILGLEDYALLFGSLIVFALLATVMYLTRNINWFEVSNNKT